MESEYNFFKIEGIRESNYWTEPHYFQSHLFGQNPNESIYGLESEYISFFAMEYEYNYPVTDMDLSPRSAVHPIIGCTIHMRFGCRGCDIHMSYLDTLNPVHSACPISFRSAVQVRNTQQCLGFSVLANQLPGSSRGTCYNSMDCTRSSRCRDQSGGW